MPGPEPRTAVFFDGSCPLCQAEINLYRDRDPAGRLYFVDVSKPHAALPPTLDPETAMARFHVMARDGRIISGAEAFAEIWRSLPGWRWAATLASLPFVSPTLELAYRLFLRLRPAVVRLFVASRRLGTAP